MSNEKDKQLLQQVDRMQAMAREACAELKVKGCVMILLNQDESFGMSIHGMTAEQVNTGLTVAIHLNYQGVENRERKALEGPGAHRQIVAPH